MIIIVINKSYYNVLPCSEYQFFSKVKIYLCIYLLIH